MFFNGQKVRVVASTVHEIGPRTGSTGYIGYSNTRFIKDLGFATYAIVFFNKYGFEEKERAERKVVMSVLPADTTASKAVKSLSSKNACMELTKQLEKYYAAGDAAEPKVLLVPDNMSNILCASDLEKLCWLRSVLSAESRHGYIRMWITSQPSFNFQGFNKNDVDRYLSLVDEPTKELSNAIGYVPIFASILGSYIAFSMLHLRDAANSVVQNVPALRRIIQDGRYMRTAKEVAALMDTMGRYMFRDITFSTLKSIFYNTSSHQGKSTADVINQIERLRTDLLSINN